VENKNKANLLIVDDEPEICDLLQVILSRRYQLVESAKNGAEALDMLKKRQYDLVILDLNMPKMSGEELAKTIRAQGNHRTAIITLTGHGTFKDAHSLLKDAGISDFLNKPIDQAELLFSIERALREQKLTFELEEEVNKRTAELRISQAMLIQTEKMASLGRLVAGIAHEVNTPIGTALLSISHLEDRERAFSNSLNSGGISKKTLEALLESIRETAHESKNALGEANRLILSFKQLAVDQTSGRRHTFNLKDLLTGIFSTLHIDRLDAIKADISCPDNITLNSFPGSLGQVFNSLIENSLLHAFEGGQAGAITINVADEGNNITIHYHDNGIGMSPSVMKKIFDPFFTTKINQGGNGIGLSVTFNLITSILGGTIVCESTQGEGTTFIIHIPLNATDKKPDNE
jgi:signal transduction histidine kinase